MMAKLDWDGLFTIATKVISVQASVPHTLYLEHNLKYKRYDIIYISITYNSFSILSGSA